MAKDTLTEEKAKKNPSGGVLVGKREGQTIIHDKGTAGGYLVGKLHKEGGIKGVNKATGQPIEVQGGEVIITAPAVADQTKREFEGEMLTNREILSKINEKGGGVSFANGGEMPKEIYYNGSTYNFGGKTMSDYDIMRELSSCGCEHEYNDGGSIVEGVSLGYSMEIIQPQILNENFSEGGEVFSSVVDNWDKVPSNYKNTSKVKKVPFTNNPLDKGLDNIITVFLSKDELRQNLTGINFDKNGITATDGHKLIMLPYPNEKYNGIYDLQKNKKEKTNELLLIDSSYPNYEAVIPKSKYEKNEGLGDFQNISVFKISVYKLLQYTKTALNYANKTTHQIVFKYGENKIIGFHGKLLIEVLNSILKLGHEKIYAFISQPNRAIVFSPNENYVVGEDEVLLLMPVMVFANQDGTYNLGAYDLDFSKQLEVYYDFSDDEIHNADGSIAEFKMQYEDNLGIDKNYLSLISKITKKRKSIYILEFAKVEDGKMTASDLEVSISIKNVNLPNGVYAIENDAPTISMQDLEEFPNSPIYIENEVVKYRDNDKKTSFEFLTFSEVFEFYLEKLLLSVGNDDLRPVMSGICIKKTLDNEIFLVSTNAQTLCKINITEYCDFNKDDRELEYIIPVTYLKDFVKQVDGSLHFKCNVSNIFIETSDLEFISKTIDGKYPNYDAVIPKDNTKQITFDYQVMKKCLDSPQIKSTIAKYKGENVSYEILNSGEKLFFRVAEVDKWKRGKTEYLEEIELCNIELKYVEKNNFYNLKDSVFLIMPVMSTPKPNQYFCFSYNLFNVMMNTITDTEVECYFSEPNRAYIFPIDAIDYKKTLPEEKSKEQPKKKERAKKEVVSAEKKEIMEAVQTLKMLADIEDNEAEKMEILEALEILNMISKQTFEDGGMTTKKLMFEPIKTPLN